MALSANEVDTLIDDGWDCSNYPVECESDDHDDGLHLIESERDKVELSGNAVRLHVGEVFSPDEHHSNSVLSLFSGTLNDFNARRPSDEEDRNPLTKGAIQIPPGKFVYFITEEIVNLPFDVCGHLFMNPKISNKGLLFFTTGHVAPGWTDHLTGTLVNMTDQNVYLSRSEPVLYLTLFKTGSREACEEDDIDPFSCHNTHENPPRSIGETLEGELVHPDPGFARTTQFVTKQDLYQVTIIAIGALSIIITLLVFALNTLLNISPG